MERLSGVASFACTFSLCACDLAGCGADALARLCACTVYTHRLFLARRRRCLCAHQALAARPPCALLLCGGLVARMLAWFFGGSALPTARCGESVLRRGAGMARRRQPNQSMHARVDGDGTHMVVRRTTHCARRLLADRALPCCGARGGRLPAPGREPPAPVCKCDPSELSFILCCLVVVWLRLLRRTALPRCPRAALLRAVCPPALPGDARDLLYV